MIGRSTVTLSVPASVVEPVAATSPKSPLAGLPSIVTLSVPEDV
jgi:hypothetical protein